MAVMFRTESYIDDYDGNRDDYEDNRDDYDDDHDDYDDDRGDCDDGKDGYEDGNKLRLQGCRHFTSTVVLKVYQQLT
ncbi:hypothetical protein ElyMa_002988200 [Elysia marginata]|uniref:Uncharacterized protein n=1 Tax=Elysia marginata TaxID=1093978 RepID=A0AAV4ID44_9GAST|nr:hypothetical protein ElyMa_002988200 [Elysia marginata]